MVNNIRFARDEYIQFRPLKRLEPGDKKRLRGVKIRHRGRVQAFDLSRLETILRKRRMEIGQNAAKFPFQIECRDKTACVWIEHQVFRYDHDSREFSTEEVGD